MINQSLATFYERDIRLMMSELSAFKDELNVWETAGSVRNSSGNLVLHIIGGSNYLVGAKLGNTDYVRNRDLEFSKKNIPRPMLLRDLEELIPMIKQVLANVDLDADYPMMFDGAIRSNGYVLLQLSLHLNYHLGQINYLRRILET